MKRIPLTQGKFAVVDDEDFQSLNRFKWYAHCRRHTGNFYATRHGEQREMLLMHRVILGLRAGEECDHINHDSLDNRRSNLRKCTSQQNQWNRRRRRPGFKGVRKLRNKWGATIMVSGVRNWLGTFDNPESAARAYDAMAAKHFRQFAVLNFPKEHHG